MTKRKRLYLGKSETRTKAVSHELSSHTKIYFSGHCGARLVEHLKEEQVVLYNKKREFQNVHKQNKCHC